MKTQPKPWVIGARGMERSAREEISIGAYARRQRRRRLWIGALGVLLMGGAAGVYWALRPPESGPETGNYAVRIQCGECGHSETIRVSFRQSFPMVCPRCRQRAARELWKCRDCGEVFVPRGGAEEHRCPRCGGVRVGSAALD